DPKGRIDARGIRQCRLTPCGAGRQCPAKSQRIAIGIARAAAIELHGLPHHDRLIEARIGYRAPVHGGHSDGGGRPVRTACGRDSYNIYALYTPSAVLERVPVMRQVVGSILNPGGKPVALQVTRAPVGLPATIGRVTSVPAAAS